TSCNIAPRAIAFRRVEYRLQRRDGVNDSRVVDLELSRPERGGSERVEVCADVIGLRHVECLWLAITAADRDLRLAQRVSPHLRAVHREPPHKARRLE